MKKKVGILGGTFDPIHNAHITFAEAAYDQVGLDIMYIMPSPDPPHKLDCTISSLDDRIQMVKLAISGHPKLSFSDFELKRTGPTYTYETLKQFKAQNEDAEIYLVVGEDSLYNLEDWAKPEEIFKYANIITSVREKVEFDDTNINAKDFMKEKDLISFEDEVKFLKEKYNANICVLKLGNMDISATKIRENVKNNISIKGMVPEKVEEYISEHQLYR